MIVCPCHGRYGVVGLVQVSIDDFFEAQALIRTRGKDFLFLLFQAYLAAALLLPSSSSLDAPSNASSHNSSDRGSNGGGGSEDTPRSFPPPSADVARRLRLSSLTGDSLLDSGRTRSSTGAFSADSARTFSLINSAKGVTGLSPGNARRGGGYGGGVPTEPVVGLRHVRAMFQARGLAGPTGRDYASADRVFTAAAKAAGLLEENGGRSREAEVVVSRAGAVAEAAAAAAATAPGVEAAPSPHAPLTPEKKATGGKEEDSKHSASEPPETPSKAEWERLMGDLLPSASHDDASIVIKPVGVDNEDAGVASAAAAAAELNLEKTPSVALVTELHRIELTFEAFARAARAVPVLVDAMIAESKNHALSAVGAADRNATPLVDSVVTEEGHWEGSQGK